VTPTPRPPAEEGATGSGVGVVARGGCPGPVGKLTCGGGLWGPVIAPSARKHGVSDRDIEHAFAHPVRAFDLDDGFTMCIGAGVSAAWWRSVSLRSPTFSGQ